MNISMLRTRWAAIGAAVAVTLGAGGLGISYAATSPTGAATYIPITPCRLADTRPAPDNVGPRNTPIGADETLTISAHGNNGSCTGIPTSATGLQLNVTAIGATSGSFLTIWATGATQPTASSLNPQPGAPPIPNAVTTGLSSGGQFNIFNKAGSVNVLVDVVGYYADHTHDSASITNEAGVSYNYTTTGVALTASVGRVVSTPMRAPSNGFVLLQASGSFIAGSAGNDEAQCQLNKGGVPASLNTAAAPFITLNDLGNTTLNENIGFSTQRMIEISSADNPFLFTSGQTLALDCVEVSGTTTIDDIHITAMFFPTSYEPAGFIFPVFPLFPSEGEIAPPSE